MEKNICKVTWIKINDRNGTFPPYNSFLVIQHRRNGENHYEANTIVLIVGKNHQWILKSIGKTFMRKIIIFA
jgi:hypothetical protein